MSVNNTNPGEALRQARINAGILQADLAAAVGVSGAMLGRYEIGLSDLEDPQFNYRRGVTLEQFLQRLPAELREPLVEALVERHKRKIEWLRAIGNGIAD